MKGKVNKTKLIYALLLTIGICGCAEPKQEKKRVERKEWTIQQKEKRTECEVRNYKSYDKHAWENLTPVQKSAIAKTFEMKEDSLNDHVYPFYASEYITPEEHDAKVEILVQKWIDNYPMKADVSDELFHERLKEVFGYEVVADIPEKLLWFRLSDNSVVMKSPDWYQSFLISEGTNTVIHTRLLDISFSSYKDYNSLVEDVDTSNWLWEEPPARATGAEINFHYNNYLFNEDKASRVWMFTYEKYFMYHLVSKFGYDGDSWLNKKVLDSLVDGGFHKVYGGFDLTDIPFSVVHFYPEGRIKILDGILEAVEALSTAEEAKFFFWAEDELYRYATASSDDKAYEVDDSYDSEVRSRTINPFVRKLTFEERCEAVAHITNTLYPLYLKFVNQNGDYGDSRAHAMGIDVPDAFWNVCFRDHNLFHHIVKMKGYGLPNLQKMLAALYADPRFYDENGELAPWSFTVPEE